ncbi:MAG: hypothetical protein ACJ8C4_21070 [Gemmataceae bacterium]
MRLQALLVVVAVIATMAVSNHKGVAFDDSPTKTVIRAKDIGRGVEIIGRLGVPLRQTVSVTGAWVELKFTRPQAKPDSPLRFRVESINGQRLNQPVDFRRIDLEIIQKEVIEPVAGMRCELRAYETWPKNDRHPDEFLKELNAPVSAAPERGPTLLIGVLK